MWQAPSSWSRHRIILIHVVQSTVFLYGLSLDGRVTAQSAGILNSPFRPRELCPVCPIRVIIRNHCALSSVAGGAQRRRLCSEVS
ncbi:hypothetical protein BDW72DRAFT_81364 [Aspergillus terricola var. indicus]